MRPERAAIIHRSGEVGGDDRVPVLVFQFDDRAADIDTGVIEQNIYVAKSIEGFGQRLLDLVAVGSVGF
jgi:hypothetical protein